MHHVPDVQVVRLGPLEQRGKVTGAKLVERVCRVGCQERAFLALVMTSCGIMTRVGAPVWSGTIPVDLSSWYRRHSSDCKFLAFSV
jgi:hypothetical protein